MPPIKAVIFDFIGTLIDVKSYTMEESKEKLYKEIVKAGFTTSRKDFLEAYSQAHEKYRIIRYQELVEVTNAVWISEALNSLGFKTSQNDPHIKAAVNAFFKDYLDSFELRPEAKRMLEKLSAEYKLGLISNFTYAPVIYVGLRRLGINKFFNAVLVSEDVGWRKPRKEIFAEALKRLGAAAEETVYAGDSPAEDIKGAKEAGMKTVFVPSQFYTMKNLRESQQEPDLVAQDFCLFCREFPEFLRKKN